MVYFEQRNSNVARVDGDLVKTTPHSWPSHVPKMGDDMDKVLEYRNQEMRCRQRAAYDPQQSWKWLAEAEMWEQRAHECRASLPDESNIASPSDLADTKAA
jgi:hypothetical protein